jgi:hypothetical protein
MLDPKRARTKKAITNATHYAGREPFAGIQYGFSISGV